jgi:hypothetical protein
MIFNYIVKSTSGIEINSRGEIFEKVEKASLTYPQDAVLIYNEHLQKNLSPIILKRIDKNWVEITLEQVKADYKPIGLKKAYKVKVV